MTRFGRDLLPDERYEEWAVAPRERVQRLYLDLLRAGRLSAELAEADPTDEAAHRELMEEHFEAGRLHAAIRQFQRLRTILTRELGVLPSPPTVALYRRIVGTAASGWVRPALVGRETELVRARATPRRAAEGRPGAIFVTGPAGIGKTRICEKLVEQAAQEGWFVLRAAGREQMAAVPYWSLVEAIQGVMVDRPYLGNALGDAEKALLARLTGVAPDARTGPVHRHAVLHLLSEVVAAAGARRTMLLLDDLQHVDDDSLALADVMASASQPRGVLLLAAYRADEGSPGAAPLVAGEIEAPRPKGSFQSLRWGHGEAAVVENITDGDTIRVSTLSDEKVPVRLIGVDAPLRCAMPARTSSALAEEASGQTRLLLPVGTQVHLVYDVERTDRYGHTLAYVYRHTDELFVNLALAENGHARQLAVAPIDGAGTGSGPRAVQPRC
ncbi:MAG: AAA family ATPase [Actinomycetota bacterium]|nr:AAA family ATPase [Actinomycetota bacterium]